MLGLPLRIPPGGPKKFYFLFLSFILMNGKVCANSGAITPFKFRNSVDIVGQRKVCSGASAFNFASMPLSGTVTEC